MQRTVPIINIESLISGQEETENVARELNSACRDNGFFYVKGHGIDVQLQEDLEEFSKLFFAQEEAEKMKIRMELGGRAWRGYFPVSGELTSGKPDLKEGIYFGSECGADNKWVQKGTPMFGKNLFPEEADGFKTCILRYIKSLTTLGHHLMRGLSLSLGLEETYFNTHFTDDPLTLFRIFHYPAAQNSNEANQWGVGEHTDYGLLTILKQDKVGGLQVKSRNEWIDAPYIEGTFICNIGDMLDKMTGGYYRSTPHRVRNKSHQGRLSFPFFFDPGFDAEIHPVIHKNKNDSGKQEYKRWDDADIHGFEGSYGSYILNKVSKVFPQLKDDVL
jgi:isopenicillin N synthase-like dioxygenase